MDEKEISEAFARPLALGSRTIRNRVVKSPQSTYFWEKDQSCGDRAVGFYEELAAGGTGLIVVGALQYFPCQYGRREASLHADELIEGYRRLTDAVHAHGGVVIAQFNHDGASDMENPRCSTAHTADELPCPEPYASPCAGVTKKEIADIKKAFVDAAVRAKKAGFDGVEVHTANAYYLLSFLSRIWNRRDDEYGPQTMENRTRLQCEYIREARAACGDDFIIGVRMNGQEFGHERAMSIEEGVEAARFFEQAGADYLSVTGYGYGETPFQFVADYWNYPEPDSFMIPYQERFAKGLLLPAARAIKAAVTIPVMAGGRLDEKLGAEAIRDGSVDAVLFGRPLWADPQLANKILQGKFSDIVHCTRCATCEDPDDGEPRRCRVNPSFGRENELATVPSKQPKNVVIVGGGPAGMETARIASARGHRVTLIERNSQLGGHLPLAAMVKGDEFDNIIAVKDYLIEQIRKSSVSVRLKTVATRKLVQSLSPDVVIVATGGVYRSSYTGQGPLDPESLSKLANFPIKLLGPQAVHSLSKLILPTIGKNVIVVGGQIEGIQGALYLAERGRQVTIVCEDAEIGGRIPPRYFVRGEKWLNSHKVRIEKNARITNVTKKTVEFTRAGHREHIQADSVLVFTTPQANDELYEELISVAPRVIRIGAANGEQASLVVDALRQGREIGAAI